MVIVAAVPFVDKLGSSVTIVANPETGRNNLGTPKKKLIGTQSPDILRLFK